MIDRRTLLAAAGAATLARPARAEGFSAATVEALARALAGRRYRPPPEVPAAWADLDYDQYRGIRFDQRRSLLKGTDAPLRVDLFAPGLYFPRYVGISLVEDGTARAVPFDREMFTHADFVPDLPPAPGFSGLRLRAQWNRPGIYDEFAVFQGASYFRMIPWGGIYGLSARGLAIGTGEPGEEFPDFTRFWIERPAPGQAETVIHALLDGPSVAGAYRFAVTPGTPTICEVEATLFARVETDRAGWAPLTSMFLFDGTNHRFEDWRPAVHDSNGLAILNGAGEHVWRPLANPRHLQASAFLDENPRGFGLMQRARDLADFEDLEALYHRRPSLWIEPKGDWGPGMVRLVEMPAEREIYDNVVASWLPRAPLMPGAPRRIAYRMRWSGEEAEAQVARVLATRIGRGFDGRLTAKIDFAPHPALGDDPEAVTRHLSASAGAVSDGIAERNPETGGLRLTFAFEPGEAATVELRAQLRRAGAPATEVWLYRWTA